MAPRLSFVIRSAAAIQYKASTFKLSAGMLPAKPWFPSSTRAMGLSDAISSDAEKKTIAGSPRKNQEDCQQRRLLSIVVEKDEAQELEQSQSKLSARFEAEMCQRVREWMTLAEEKLVPNHMQLFFMPGNDDLPSIDAVIDEFEHVHNPDMKRFVIEGDYKSSVTPTLI